MAKDATQQAKPEKNEKKLLWITKHKAAAFAGFMAGLIAGIAVAIPLGKEIDDDVLRLLVLGLLCLSAALGGTFTALITAGYFTPER